VDGRDKPDHDDKQHRHGPFLRMTGGNAPPAVALTLSRLQIASRRRASWLREAAERIRA
jgi:hypothetical protein